jgi:hypothetical protein
LSDEKSERLRLAGAILGDGSRQPVEHLADDAVDRGGVVDHREAVGRDDVGRPAPGGEHLVEDLLRDRARDGTVVDEDDQFRECVRRERRGVDRSPRLVQLRGERAHHPIARGLRVAGAGGDALEIVGERHGLCQDARVVLRQVVLLDEAAAARVRKLRQGPADPLDPRPVEDERRQIRLRKVTVVVRFLFRAHQGRAVRSGIEQTRFLDDRRPVLPRRDVALDLEFDGTLHVAERVEVLELGLDPERRRPGRSHRHVRVAPQASLFHVAVVHAQGHEHLAHAAEGLGRVRRGPEVRLGDDLDERHAAAVEVQVGPPRRIGAGVVQRLAGVLFHVHAGDPDRDRAAGRREADGAARRERAVVLGNLVALGQIGIEVVLSREDRPGMDLAAQREGRTRGEFHGAAIQHRQRPRQAQAHRAQRGIGRRAEASGTPAEDLGGGQQLRVNLEADDRLKVGHG